MGCDIHSMLEYRGKRWDKDREEWVRDTWIKSKVHCFPYEYAWLYPEWSNADQPFTPSPFGTRDYALFAMLADVRNDGSIRPVYEGLQEESLRGVPEDATKSWRKYVGEGDYSDIHSATYYTLAELKRLLNEGAFKQEIETTAYIAPRDFLKLRINMEEPQYWHTTPGPLQHIPERDARLIGTLRIELDKKARLGFIAQTVELEQQRGEHAIPPMPGEAVDLPRPASPMPAPYQLPELPRDDMGREMLHGARLIHATWKRTIDREAKIREVIEVASNFATLVGEKPRPGEPDTRERDLTTVRIMIGFDN